jgi:tetratricopeptide (TPR) repeat protein
MEALTAAKRAPCVNWLEELVESYEERQAAMKARLGDTLFKECICALCCYQKKNEVVEQVPHECVNEVGYLYMRSSDFEKAEALFRRVIEHAKKERGGEFHLGESYHALGACLLSQGKWQEAHKVWRDGLAQAASHVRLRETVAKLVSFDVRAASSSDSSQQLQCEEMYSEDVGYSDAVSGNHHLQRKIFLVGGEGLVSGETCDWVVQRAEEHARNHRGWTRKRHYGAPTTDLPVPVLDDVLRWFTGSFFPALRPALQKHFYASDKVDAEVAIHDAFIVKYDANTADGQKFLPEHTDESTHSLIVALNGRGEYVGGGTHFPALKATVRPHKGQVLCFTGGSLRHSGEPIFEGVRYIIAAFLLLGKQTRAREGKGQEDGKAFSFRVA